MSLKPSPGWTLLELVVALVIFGVVAGLGAGAVASEQRTARAAARVRAMRAELRDATGVLAQEIRGASPASDTLRLAADTAVEFFTPLLTAITCAPGSGSRLLLVPPLNSSAMQPAVGPQPDTGDLAWIWEEDSVRTPGTWRRWRIAGYASDVPENCSVALAPLVGQPRVLTVAGDAGMVPAGAPVQVVRRGRYSIYRASDGDWYLGYRRCDALGPSRCQAVQPVAGPYRARVNGTAGIQFRYFGETGNELTGMAAVTATWRVDVVLRSDTNLSTIVARRSGALDDSVVMTVGLRNAR